MCIISYLSLNDNIYLAKNRDRYYITPIKLIRDYLNKTEIVYLQDNKSGWIEGINQYGISLINSVLPITREEIILKKGESKIFINDNSISSDGAIILKALSQSRIQDALTILLKCNCHGKGSGLFGHTILSDGQYTISLEYTSKSLPIIKSINKLYVRTNHTIYLPINKELPTNQNQTCVYMEVEKYNQIDELEPNPVNTNATHNNRFSGRVNSSFAVIPISSDSGSIIYQSDSNSSLSYFSPPIEQIPKIKVKFRYHDGTLVDFGNNELHFRIEFNTLTNQQQKNMTINVPEGNFI